MHTENETKLIKAGNFLAEKLAPAHCELAVEYWRANFPILRRVTELRDGLSENIRKFKKSANRTNGTALFSDLTLIWQVVRTLGNVSGPDRMLKNQLLPEDWQTIPRSSAASFHVEAEAIDLMNTFYSWDTCVRHPKPENFQFVDWMFQLTWPDERCDQLIKGALVSRGILATMVAKFDPRTGFEGDCAEKQSMIDQVANNRCAD